MLEAKHIKENVFQVVELASKGLSNTIQYLSFSEKYIFLHFDKEKNALIFYEYISFLDIAVKREGKSGFVFLVDEFTEKTKIHLDARSSKINEIITAHSKIFTLFPSVFESYCLNPTVQNETIIYAYKIKAHGEIIAEKINATLSEEFNVSASCTDSVIEITYPRDTFLIKLDRFKKALQQTEWNTPFLNIFHAAIAGNISGIKFFIEKGENVDVLDSRNETPLHYAVANQNIEAIEFLLESGANINALNDKGISPIYYAAFLGYSEAVGVLLTKKANCDGLSLAKQTLMHILAKTKHIETIKVALNHGVDINARDSDNKTPLHYAINHRCTETALFLIEENANFELEDDDGVTPLLLASCLGNISVIISLLKKGADINKQRINHRANMHASNKLGFIEYFNGDTPIHWAAIQGNLEVVKLLLLHGADINVKDSENNTPLHHAAARGYIEIAEYLLAQGALIDIQGSLKMRPLDLALSNGHKKMSAVFSKMSIARLVDLIPKDQNKSFTIEIKEKKIVLVFKEECFTKTFLTYLKLLIVNSVKAKKNTVSFPMSEMQKIDSSDMSKKIFYINKILCGHDEIFSLFPGFFNFYSLDSATQEEYILCSYQMNKSRLDDVVQKFNQALRVFEVSAISKKGFVNLKFPREVFLSQRFEELKKAIVSINWHATTSINIKPVSAVSFQKHGSIDEIEREAELERRRNERKERNEREKEEELQKLFLECRLKTQCEDAPLDDWSEIGEALPKPKPIITVVGASESDKSDKEQPDQRVGGVKLIREEMDDKGKEEAPSEMKKGKKKEKKKPMRQKMSLIELEEFISSKSSSSSPSVNEDSKIYAKGFQYYRERDQAANKTSKKRLAMRS